MSRYIRQEQSSRLARALPGSTRQRGRFAPDSFRHRRPRTSPRRRRQTRARKRAPCPRPQRLAERAARRVRAGQGGRPLGRGGRGTIRAEPAGTASAHLEWPGRRHKRPLLLAARRRRSTLASLQPWADRFFDEAVVSSRSASPGRWRSSRRYREGARRAVPPAIVILRVDLTALRRGETSAGEICEIPGGSAPFRSRRRARSSRTAS